MSLKKPLTHGPLLPQSELAQPVLPSVAFFGPHRRGARRRHVLGSPKKTKTPAPRPDSNRRFQGKRRSLFPCSRSTAVPPVVLRNGGL